MSVLSSTAPCARSCRLDACVAAAKRRSVSTENRGRCAIPTEHIACVQLTRAAEFVTVEHLADAIQDYIRYYNEERIKAKLGTSPVSFRAREVAA